VIVIDASALTKFIFKEEGWSEVRKVLERGAVSIDHIVKEVSNAIWKKCTVLKLELDDVAHKRFRLLREIVQGSVVVLEDESKYLDEAFRIAIENGISIYDSLYIAQALRLEAQLLTSDKRQAHVAERLLIPTRYVP